MSGLVIGVSLPSPRERGESKGEGAYGTAHRARATK